MENNKKNDMNLENVEFEEMEQAEELGDVQHQRLLRRAPQVLPVSQRSGLHERQLDPRPHVHRL